MTGTMIVGAGPAGLACALALRCHGLDEGMDVVDPTGTWLSAWSRRFQAQDIPHLRSPAVHHPHPDPFALLRFADGDGLVRSGGTHLPTTALFHRFVRDTIVRAGLAGEVAPLGARGLEVDDAGAPTVWLSDGTVRRPDRLILATNARRPVVPPALRGAARAPWLRIGDDTDVGSVPPGCRVVVLGGGLSAAHLAIGAARRGAHVTLLTRRRLAVRRFDTHPSWLGPKKRRPFERERDPQVRRRAIDAARGGGSIPHRYRWILEELAADGVLDLQERRVPVGVDDTARAVRLHTADGGCLDADAVWLATGGQLDVTRDPLCAALVRRGTATIVDGLPDLESDLSWPGTRIHLVGFAAALVLGPTAGNLIGHRRAAQRIVARLQGHDPAQADRVATGPGVCPGTSAVRSSARR